MGPRPPSPGPRRAPPLLLLLLGQARLAVGPRPPPSFPLPPDTRPEGCKAHQLEDPEGRDFEDLKASIIIPYRNEKWEHIQGSLESVLFYTPRKYLAEILLVSDGNGRGNLHAEEIRSLAPKLISVLALPKVGLIQAKMRAVAAAISNASVLLFLEPHVRVNRQWIQPLLRRIREYPKVLAMPLLDLIPQDNWGDYRQGASGLWRFEWNFNLAYTNPGGLQDDQLMPFTVPATSGGIFAIRRDWWDKLEFYDTGMIGWGGDHVEATFKVWRCGGHIDVVPCSRIGHLFRDPDHRPYQVETEQVVRNYARIAKVWLDEYIDRFYRVKADALDLDLGDLSSQLALRERLQCKDMTWYLENVDQEMNWEKDHVCVPGCSREEQGDMCCERPAAAGRSTIDRIMPAEVYRELDIRSPPAFRSEVFSAAEVADEAASPEDVFGEGESDTDTEL